MLPLERNYPFAAANKGRCVALAGLRGRWGQRAGHMVGTGVLCHLLMEIRTKRHTVTMGSVTRRSCPWPGLSGAAGE